MEEGDVLGCQAVNEGTARGNELQERLVAFSAEVVRLSYKLPKSAQGRHFCGQILRCGTAVASNYAEARGAESRADFVHKLKLVLKELNETTIWLELIARLYLLPSGTIVAIVAENKELCRIIGASIRTARSSN